MQVLENNLDAEKLLFSYGGFNGSRTHLLDIETEQDNVKHFKMLKYNTKFYAIFKGANFIQY